MNTRNRVWHTVAEDAEPTTTIRKLPRRNIGCAILYRKPITKATFVATLKGLRLPSYIINAMDLDETPKAISKWQLAACSPTARRNYELGPEETSFATSFATDSGEPFRIPANTPKDPTRTFGPPGSEEATSATSVAETVNKPFRTQAHTLALTRKANPIASGTTNNRYTTGEPTEESGRPSARPEDHRE
ncbi:hypothetical protein QR680_013326 [Steinernema hermaphroditum]|uniref:Uncharacterized protein n=1 Tax=Steinernema hermaphroditum TaxID=289476 RepID=A0AA39I6P1_9BILA|nr:hypothetical protein QR680_013326 [Steinernema hermaphroditum]